VLGAASTGAGTTDTVRYYGLAPSAGPAANQSAGSAANNAAMFHVVLVQPQIPPNTGNVIRLCANVGAALHLVEPLGFDIDDASLRRAGLDYREYVDMAVHASLDECRAAIGEGGRWFGFSREGTTRYDRVAFEPGDVLVFGSEATGLAPEVRATFGDRLVSLPMRPDNRSLNLSNAVAVVAYEAWRQNGFAGAAPVPPGSVA